MSGLRLAVGGSMGGGYTPMTPAAANAPSANSTVGQAAFGISGTGADNQSKVAGYGSVAVGAVAMVALLYIWSTLPR